MINILSLTPFLKEKLKRIIIMRKNKNPKNLNFLDNSDKIIIKIPKLLSQNPSMEKPWDNKEKIRISNPKTLLIKDMLLSLSEVKTLNIIDLNNIGAKTNKSNESPLNSKFKPILIITKIKVIIIARFPDLSSIKNSLSSRSLRNSKLLNIEGKIPKRVKSISHEFKCIKIIPNNILINWKREIKNLNFNLITFFQFKQIFHFTI